MSETAPKERDNENNMNALVYIGIAIGSYLIGSISPAIIISHNFQKKDIRNYGSGNAGSTNMVRTFGWGLGLFTFLLDIFKGALVVFSATKIAPLINDTLGICYLIASLCVIAGHSWPVYYKFRGGKGVATTLGVLLVLMTWPTLGCLAIAILTIITTGMVSVGSIIGVVLCAVCSFVFYNDTVLSVTICTLAAFVIFLHRQNILRIIKGTENKLVFKRK